jgi:hypothetical protein
MCHEDIIHVKNINILHYKKKKNISIFFRICELYFLSIKFVCNIKYDFKILDILIYVLMAYIC